MLVARRDDEMRSVDADCLVLGRLDLVPGPREEIVQIAEFLLEREF